MEHHVKYANPRDVEVLAFVVYRDAYAGERDSCDIYIDFIFVHDRLRQLRLPQYMLLMVQMLYNEANQHGSNDARIILTVNGRGNERDRDGPIYHLHRLYVVLGFEETKWGDISNHLSHYRQDAVSAYVLHQQVHVTHSVFSDLYRRYGKKT